MLEPSIVPGSKIHIEDCKDLLDLPMIPLSVYLTSSNLTKLEIVLTVFTAINGNELKGPFMTEVASVYTRKMSQIKSPERNNQQKTQTN